MKLLRNTPLTSKKVLLRADFDVPKSQFLEQSLNTFRLEELFPSLDYILEQQPHSLTLIGHRGRPQKVENFGASSSFSLDPIKDFFKEYENKFKRSGIAFKILDNLRFNAGEEENSFEFAKELSLGVDIFVQDCFAVCHRNHASVVGVPKLVPLSVAGFNVERETSSLEKLLSDNVVRPYIVIIGGAKVETKLPLISEFEKVADSVLQGSKYLGDALDLDGETLDRYLSEIESGETILWNGPVGQYELEEYSSGTRKIAEAVSTSSAYKVVGGGDTINALTQYNLLDKIDFVSSGGGAMLEFVLGHSLPGLKVLN